MGRLTEIVRFYDPEEAICASALLRAHAVYTLIKNEHHLTMVPSLRIALGGYQLWVLAEDTERAASALESIRNIDLAEHGEGVLNEEQGRTERRKKEWLWLPIAFASGVPFIPPRRTGALHWFQLVAMASLYSVFSLTLWLSWS